jgi:hypothetical protein
MGSVAGLGGDGGRPPLVEASPVPAPESLADLDARLTLLERHNVAAYNPQTGAVTFFPPRATGPSLTTEQAAKLEEARAKASERAQEARVFGAAGGARPNVRSEAEIAADKAAVASADALRAQRQEAKARAAQAQLDGRRGSQ